MIGGVNFASSQIASAYNTGSQQLAATLTRIATGKKFQNAAEDLTGFLRSQNLKVDISGYEQARQDLTSFKSYTSAAVEASSSIYEALTKMKDIASKYDAADTDQQAEYAAEFDSLQTQVDSLITNTSVDGDSLIATATITSVTIDPQGTTLDMTFTDSTDVSGLDLAGTDGATTEPLVDAEIASTLTYMSEAKSFDGIADQQLKLTDTIVNSKQAVLSLITDIDDAEETNKALDQSIRQQAAMSMLAQANVSRQAVMKLYM